MGKRYVETEMADKEWWQLLHPNFKSLWEYMRLKCDPAGVWSVNRHGAESAVGTKFQWGRTEEAIIYLQP